ncbi:hypothetical protein TSAR_014873 [Trichomalopsis sarcophagae]|uniref:Uncharacterized protein n=1 Tax=Trichomalopsis sarcophagae TaxID=543379 RepID=A0A232EDM3_9HYME|nr:hypothetical protein TSAR_014873 [Trichomalopsis sarcophagae]
MGISLAASLNMRVRPDVGSGARAVNGRYVPIVGSVRLPLTVGKKQHVMTGRLAWKDWMIFGLMLLKIQESPKNGRKKYKVGEKVWARNRILSSAAQAIAAKLSPKYAGPFIGSARVGMNSYKLQTEQGVDIGKVAVCDLKPCHDEEQFPGDAPESHNSDSTVPEPPISPKKDEHAAISQPAPSAEWTVSSAPQIPTSWTALEAKARACRRPRQQAQQQEKATYEEVLHFARHPNARIKAMVPQDFLTKVQKAVELQEHLTKAEAQWQEDKKREEQKQALKREQLQKLHEVEEIRAQLHKLETQEISTTRP